MDWVWDFNFLHNWHFNFLVHWKLFCVVMMDCVNFIWNLDFDSLMMAAEFYKDIFKRIKLDCLFSRETFSKLSEFLLKSMGGHLIFLVNHFLSQNLVNF
jgi:hypothetical protein